MFKNTFCTGWELKSAHKPANVGVNTKLTYEPESLLGPPARNKMSSKNTSKEIYQNVIIKTIINVIKTIIISDCRPSSIFLISVIDYMLCWWTNYNNNNNNIIIILMMTMMSRCWQASHELCWQTVWCHSVLTHVSRNIRTSDCSDPKRIKHVLRSSLSIVVTLVSQRRDWICHM